MHHKEVWKKKLKLIFIWIDRCEIHGEDGLISVATLKPQRRFKKQRNLQEKIFGNIQNKIMSMQISFTCVKPFFYDSSLAHVAIGTRITKSNMYTIW